MRIYRSLCPWLADSLTTVEAAAQRERLGHGWLISGPRDIGKRNLAYVLAERLLHHEIGSPAPPAASPAEIFACDEALAGGMDLHPDLFRLKAEEDKRTISVEQVRDVTAELTLKPLLAGLKVVVVERSETMTTGAANALLKSLEEPTPNTYLFLIAERPGRLPATIRSRCQHLGLKSPSKDEAVNWLKTAGIDASNAPRGLLARAPLAAARALMNDKLLSIYKELYSDIDLIYDGKADPHATAEQWYRGDPELALTCLVETLQQRIRHRLVPERWNPVTDSNPQLADNSGRGTSIDALFEGLKTAENLREQIGRGINVELAFRSLLMLLEPPLPS